jgi:hypothetical protein
VFGPCSTECIRRIISEYDSNLDSIPHLYVYALLTIARPDTIGPNRACNRSLNNWPQSNLTIYRYESVGIIQDWQLTGMV